MSVTPPRRNSPASAHADSLRIPASETRLTAVRDYLQEHSAAAALPPRDLANLRLAVDDACSAIIRHVQAKPGSEIEIAASTQRGAVQVRIVVHGGTLPFDANTQGPPAGLLLHRLMDGVQVESGPRSAAWVLRKNVRRRHGATLRARYSLRFAMALALLTAVACVPLWFLEGRRLAAAAEQSLRARAYGLVEVALPVLRSGQEFSPEQTRLTEAVLGIREQDPRILTVHVVDAERLVWASDRTAVTFTHMPEMTGLGPPDNSGVRRGMQRLEQQPILKLCVPVVAGGTSPRVLGHVYFTVRWDEVEAAVRGARLRLVFGAAIVYGLATAVIAMLFGGIVRPLQRLMDNLRNSESDKLDVDGPDEIGAIAAAFNDVRARMLTAESNAEDHENLQQDLQLAREIQTTLLPAAPPRIEGYELGRWYLPAGDVGGDYYDFLEVNDHMTGVVVADVSGKGVPGSLIMGMLRTALRMEARGNANAGDVLARMNAFLAGDMRKGMFVTMFYAILDSQSRVVSYASAGHNPMVLYRAATRETFFLKPRGFPVGLELPDGDSFGRSLDVERLRLHPGDVLVLYTDGVTDALNPSGKAYGEDRLLAAIQRFGHLPTAECVTALEADVRGYTAGATQADDITMVVIRDTSKPHTVPGIRQRLVDLVEKEGMSVEAACAQLKVSPSTYYRFKPRQAAAEAQPLAPSATATAAPAAALPAAGGTGTGLALESAGLAGTVTAMADDVGCLELRGVIDSVSSAALESLVERAAAASKRLVVQLRDVSYISSRGWGVLASGCASLRQRKGELVLAGMSDELTHVYRMLGFEQVLRAFPDAPAAKDALLRVPAKNEAVAAAPLDNAGKAEKESGTGKAKRKKHGQENGGRGHANGVTDASASANANANANASTTANVSANANANASTTASVSANANASTNANAIANANAEKPANAAAVPPGPAVKALPVPQMPLPEDLDDAIEHWESLRVRRGVVGPAGEVLLLALEGVLDTVSARVFERVLAQAVSGGSSRILVDLSRTEFVSSAGWGTFTAHLRQLRGKSGDLKLFGMSPELLRIYDVLGLGSVLERFDVLSDALQAFGLAPAADPEAESPADEKHACGACTCCGGRVLRPDRGVLRQARLPEGEYGRDAALRGAGWDAYFERFGLSPWREGSMR